MAHFNTCQDVFDQVRIVLCDHLILEKEECIPEHLLGEHCTADSSDLPPILREIRQRLESDIGVSPFESLRLECDPVHVLSTEEIEDLRHASMFACFAQELIPGTSTAGEFIDGFFAAATVEDMCKAIADLKDIPWYRDSVTR